MAEETKKTTGTENQNVENQQTEQKKENTPSVEKQLEQL